MIRKQLTALLFIALLAAVAMAIVANVTFYQVVKDSEAQVRLVNFTQSHMEADMMHDAIHSDVLSALNSAAQYNSAEIEATATDIKEHGQRMRTTMQESLQYIQDPMLLEKVKAADVLMEEYISLGENLIATAQKDPLLADRQYAPFKRSFEALEDEMSAISDMAEKQTLGDEADEISSQDSGAMLLTGITVLMLLSLMALGVCIYKKLLNPLQSMIQTMIQLSQGNLEADITGAAKQDEMGAMARAIQVFKENAQKNKAMEAERIQDEARSKEEKKQALQDLAQRFEQRVQGIISSVASASTELLQTAQSMTMVIQEANDKAHSVARSADSTTGNVQTVASAAEEMTASVKEISSQVSKSTQVVADTVAKAEHADTSAKALEGAAQQIGHVVQLIQDIAEQINLLALNATIESARAGDAGKGFAVVASEVKNLATQTTKATEEIASQIEGIQVISKSVVEALNAIKISIDHVSEYAGGIASAVEEQSAVTDEIAANMQTAASGTNDIRTNINDVTLKATSAKDAAESVLEASRSLSREAETLSREVAEFLSEIRE